MTPWLQRAAWGSMAAVGITGLLYAWMAWLMTPADPMDVVNHAWQPTVLHLHLLAAPFLVFVVGVLFPAHVWPKLRSRKRERRRTGLWLAWLFPVMVLSGYLLQVAESPGVRAALVWLHAISSFGWLAAYGCHWWAGRRARGQPEAESAAEPVRRRRAAPQPKVMA
jgi:hypothetical protein